jgi:hypothetical protein
MSPTCVRLPGKPRARGNPRWRGTQRGARCAEKPPLDPDPHTWGGLRGLTVGRPGQVREEVLWLSVPKAG